MSLLASLAVVALGGVREDSAQTVARASLHAIRDAIHGTSEAPGYLTDMKFVPGFRCATICARDLLDAPSSYPSFSHFDPAAKRGWRGPYVKGDPASSDGMTIVDPWGNPIIIQVPPVGKGGSTDDLERFRYARVLSGGPDGKVQTPADPLAGLQSDGTSAARGDDLILFLNRADVYEP
jgi:hypothetical protein